MKVLEGSIDQRRLRIGGKVLERFIALPVLLIGEMNLDPLAGLADLRFGVERDGDVDRACAGMEEVNRPEIESAACEIGAHRRANDDLFHDGINLSVRESEVCDAQRK